MELIGKSITPFLKASTKVSIGGSIRTTSTDRYAISISICVICRIESEKDQQWQARLVST